MRNVISPLNTTRNPYDFLLESLTRALVTLLVPVPIAAEIIIQFKGTIAAILLNFFLVAVILLFIVWGALSGKLASGITPSSISSLTGYIESGFSDTDTPIRNPFGGMGMENAATTVNFGDFENLTINGSQYQGTEQGVDIIPSALYLTTNKAALLTNEPIVFSTLTGTTHTYVDSYGALIVEITNVQTSIKTVYIHLRQILVGDNKPVHAGQPIGIMGSTGLSTGPHLEYQVRLNQGGSWVAVNPTSFIH